MLWMLSEMQLTRCDTMTKKRECKCGCKDFLVQVDNCEGGKCVEKCENCGCDREDENELC